MLGYIVPLKSELKLREFEVYNAYYCSICRSIRDRYGQIPRLLLSYDSVFLAMLISAPDPEYDDIVTGRCFVHPLKKRNFALSTVEIDYAADMLLLLAYFNLRDDYEDEGKISGYIGSGYLKHIYKKIAEKYPQKAEMIASYLSELTDLEKDRCDSLDMAADKFAKTMQEVMDHDDNEPEMQKKYRKLGYHLGMWLYLIDAYDDIEKDLKNDSYNPLLLHFGYDQNEGITEFKNRIEERMRLNLMLHLSAISETVGDLELKKNKEIIENVIYLGLLKRTEVILSGQEEETDAKPV